MCHAIIVENEEKLSLASSDVVETLPDHVRRLTELNSEKGA